MRICVTRTNKDSYSETFLKSQAEGLAGYAEVYSLYGGWLPEFEESGKFLNPRPYWLLHKVCKNILKKENNYFGNYGLIRFLKGNEIDIVLVNYGVAGVKILPVCKQLNLPMVVHFHGFDAAHIPTIQKYKSDYRRLFEYASAIIAVSHDMATQLISLGASPDKVFINVYGIDLHKFTPGDPSKTGRNFIAVARFVAKKAPQNSIFAFKKVLNSFPDATLTMVGAKEELYKDCLVLARELNIENKVVFAGQKSLEEIVPILHQSRAFVQHSIIAPDGDSEGTPNAILEASACALPIVSTFHGGIRDAVIHGETGFLVDEGDVAGMAHYMALLAEHPEMARTMGLKGRAYMQQHYELSKQISKLFRILEDVLLHKNV